MRPIQMLGALAVLPLFTACAGRTVASPRAAAAPAPVATTVGAPAATEPVRMEAVSDQLPTADQAVDTAAGERVLKVIVLPKGQTPYDLPTDG